MTRLKKLKASIKLKRQSIIDQVKAARRGSREAELHNSHGFVARIKVHKSKKGYSRKNLRLKNYD